MNIDKIFTAKAVAAYWTKLLESQNIAPYFGESFFPVKKKLGLDLKFIKGKSGLPVTLKPAAFDAQVPVRDRIGVASFQTEMPLFRDSFMISEKDRQDILRIREASDPAASVILGNIYDDAKQLIMGAAVVQERMRMQLLSPADGSPKIRMAMGDVVYEYNYDADGSFAATNFLECQNTAKWTDHSGSDPIADIDHGIDVVETNTGDRPAYILMTKKTLNDLVANDKIKSYVLAKAQASGGAVRMTANLVKQYLAEEFGLTVVVYNKKFTDETGTAQQFYPDNMVTLLPESGLGNTYMGTTPEEADLMANSDSSVAIVNTGVAITVITKNEVPVNTQTFASEICLPSFEGMDKVYIIKTA